MKKTSMENVVYQHLRNAILSRKLAPGKQLKETTISEALQVSRTPIRNAIQKLSLEGLVDLIPNKGAFVTNPTRDEIIQAYQLRDKLEYMAVCTAIDYMDENDYEEISRLIEEEHKVLVEKNVEEYVTANKQFHLLITRKCQNKFLNSFIETLINQTSIYLILYDDFFENPLQKPYSPKEHKRILELIKNNKKDELKIELSKHFEHALESVDNQYRGYKELDEIF
ncbi:GntR family transcriptional regulator [Heyndrickxia sporothermodurans]|uniref:GntR family transcriptional regulator n=1 Tax=Heyndrickxia sporothermodurans TaxID=46224 RepID=A0AB37HHU6_9BACI|nr:GntR family transcriptional regulator [Heyndrickxia sporothermodurans]MBL5772136.1 GntR family transcriptional regulator [Heyndrickxia sporothermodurans]MBL5776059.1 GntR family transcriptional regulator [Heyndrickxia sporothermodurans]MBL5782732.1 GntR family transcriptional regulator [Heyndrickxia sporothermodurans]MBL5797142.1 GntR family transcriptional regulator [Heyndrickxia sporothermodurans]MBL5800534.1 GntR family transcriptional regulator [Heyndrickxia sporothermodurans]